MILGVENALKMQPTIEESGLDSEMKSQERFDEKNCINLERYRNLVRTYIDLVNIFYFIKFHAFFIIFFKHLLISE